MDDNGNQYKKLASDTVIMAIGNFSTKVLIFLLLPLYTYILSTEEYGVADMFTTTITMLVPVLTLSISESTFRFAFDREVNQKSNLCCSIIIIASSALLVIPMTFILGQWNGCFSEYLVFFILLYVGTAFCTCLSNYARGTNHIKTFVFSSVLYTLLLVTCNILCLTVLRLGLKGYFLSTIIAYGGTNLFLFIRLKCWRALPPRNFNWSLLRSMLKFSIPIIFSTVGWWVMNSVDKYMIVEFFSLEESGLYGAAQKLPTILSVIGTIFVQAWQISAIDSYKSKGSNEFYTKVYNVYSVGLFVACAMLIAITKPLASFLFQKEYFQAYVYSPLLILSGLMSCLASFLQSPFVAAKKSNVLVISTLCGVAFNIVGNIVLMMNFGIIGAAYATLIGFGITWAIRIFTSKKYIRIQINWLTYGLTLLLLAAEALLVTYDVKYSIIWTSLIVVAVIVLHLKTICQFIVSGIKMLKKH